LTRHAENAIIRQRSGTAGNSLAPCEWSRHLASYELIVQTEFAAAHRLREYDGNCERLHGHNWKVDVVLRGEALDNLGMVLDFRDAKRLVREVLADFDHQYLNDIEPFREQNPTTENLARTLSDAIAAKLAPGVSVRSVTCWESDKCGVTYRPAT